MSSWTKLRGWLLGGVLLLSTAAASAGKSSVALGEIELRAFDRVEGAIAKLEEVEDPFGMFVDAVFLVQVKGNFEGNKPMKLTVVVSAPKEESEAGARRAWKVTQTRELHALPQSGVIQVPFLMPYECASSVKVVATLTGPGVKDSKKLDTAFPCAE
ncbi:hypothetical protein [Myxococcus sp. Y35]|uniref:hypothetical protein n=1 Tax=Pseudomyxococcus flavus TaxID=3115648 RepID=UPI003CE6DD85